MDKEKQELLFPILHNEGYNLTLIGRAKQSAIDGYYRRKKERERFLKKIGKQVFRNLQQKQQHEGKL